MTKKENQIAREQSTPDHRGKLSPFRVFVDVTGSNATNTMNVFGLDTYVWYPEGVVGKHIDDYFDNFNFIDFAVGSTKVGRVLTRAIDKVPPTLKNKFTSKLPTKVKNVLKIDDHDNPLSFLMETPHIIMYEFQPNNGLGELTGMLKGAFKKFDTFFKDDTNNNSIGGNIKALFDPTSTAFSEFMNDLLGDSYNADNINKSYGKVVDIPNFFYKNLIGGYYTAQYTLPFFEQFDYLHGMGSTGWTSRSMKQRAFGPLAGMIDKFSDALSSFDMASKPKWTMDGSGPTSDEITFEMTLFNHTLDDTIKNMVFLHALVGGNMWVQSVFQQLSPSLYDIEVPGRYRYFFCKADIKVEWVGKQRVPPTGFISTLRSQLHDSFMDDDDDLNEHAFKFIPDAYKLTIVYSSLVPNNFNTYLNYMISGSNDVGVGDIRQSPASKVSSGIMNALTKSSNETADNIALATKGGGLAEG